MRAVQATYKRSYHPPGTRGDSVSRVAVRARFCHPAVVVKNQLGLRPSHSARGLKHQLDMLSDGMREALFAAFEAYEKLSVPFALVGGLAAGAHGRPRFTKDIDFLVGDEAFTRSGLIIAFAKPMPLQAGEVAIDPIPLPEDVTRKAVLQRALDSKEFDDTTGVAIPILGATWLSYMKLASPRGKDRDDIVGMLQAGSVDRVALEGAIRGDSVLLERWQQALAELALADEG